ncbi:MAG TPA: hypothetical protein PLZ84_08190, partial [Clostridia bacterium]|nr:hypothetical protein [Clostridia bacterium]
NTRENVESAALHFANILFTVPQVSVRISMLPEDHKKMLAFYLKFWTENRDLLLDGEFTPLSPEAHYPALISQTNKEYIVALYNRLFLDLPAGKQKIIIVNATPQESVALNIPAGGKYYAKTYDCMGNVVHEGVFTPNGPVEFKIPRSGIWIAKAV